MTLLEDGDKVPNQASYEAVSPLLISCPHHCLVSFVFFSTYTAVESPDGGDLSPPFPLVPITAVQVDRQSHIKKCVSQKQSRDEGQKKTDFHQ